MRNLRLKIHNLFVASFQMSCLDFTRKLLFFKELDFFFAFLDWLEFQIKQEFKRKMNLNLTISNFFAAVLFSSSPYSFWFEIDIFLHCFFSVFPTFEAFSCISKKQFPTTGMPSSSEHNNISVIKTLMLWNMMNNSEFNKLFDISHHERQMHNQLNVTL